MRLQLNVNNAQLVQLVKIVQQIANLVLLQLMDIFWVLLAHLIAEIHFIKTLQLLHVHLANLNAFNALVLMLHLNVRRANQYRQFNII